MHRGHPSRGSVELFLGDAALITLAAVVGWYLPGGQMSNGSHKLLSLLVMLPAFLAAMYVCNLYHLVGVNGLGTFVKVIVAVGTASAFCDGFFHVFQWKNATYYWSLGACTVVAPVVIYGWRRVYFHSARRMRTPEKLVVVVSPRDAEILSAQMGPVHAQYSVVGVLRVEGKRAEAQPAAVRLPQLTPAVVGLAAGAYDAGTAVAMAWEAAPMRGTEVTASENAPMVADFGPATSESLVRVVATCDVKVVVVHNEAMTFELAEALTRLRFSGVQVYSLLDFCMRASEEIPLEILNEFWLSMADGFDLLQARFFRRVKRLTDLFLASVGLLFATAVYGAGGGSDSA